MSVRIQNDPSPGVLSPEVSRTGQSASSASGPGKGRGVTGSEGGDQVDVSSSTESISAGLSAQNLTHAARVTQLGALYASGQYNVDSAQVSQALIANAVTGSSVAGNA